MRKIIALICLPFAIFSQETPDGNTFLDHAMVAVDSSMNVRSFETVYFPWIEEYELRTETNDFDWQEQEFVLRLSPSSIKKRNAQKRMYTLLQAKPNVDLRQSYCDKTTEVHADWLSLYIIDEHISLLNQLTKILDDKSKVYEKYIGIYKFDFQKLISLEQNRTELALKDYSLKNERNYIETKYNVKEDKYDFSNFINIENILQHIATDKLFADVGDQIEDAYKLDMINAEIDLEIAERNQLLDFVQLRYRGPHDDLIKERISLGLGIRLPNSGNRKLKLKELELEQTEVLQEQALDKSEMAFEVEELKQKLKNSIKVYRFYEQKIVEERRTLKHLSEKITAQEGYNPISLLNIEEREISNQIERIELLEDIFFDYLNYLKRSGQICASQLRNYFEMP